ncbi:MAG: hypothetical protein J5923_01530 [Acidaminococcaceae bacterium]|nr:hypothetical protein [Acidaminococcaceae bacterium]
MFGFLVSAVSSIVTAIKAIVPVLRAVANVVMSICQTLGLIKPEEKVEDLGDKAIQAGDEGIRPENYANYQDYVKAVQDFQVDPEKSKRITPEEKMAKALEVQANLLAEKAPELGVEDYLNLIANHMDYFTPERSTELGKLLLTESGAVVNVADVLNGTEKNPDKINEAYDTLAKVEKQVDPTISDNEALKRAMQI